ncbi:MAG: Eco57I restriction-modification methylase domain-containing protein [Rhodobacteraceae bacterium]|nr:Eco57I restriction-modification methylase domain-containing protein [Paracoccaceae bacterium]
MGQYAPSQSGSLFTQDYLTSAIRREPAYQTFNARALADALRPIFTAFPTEHTPSEARTEDDLIWKILGVLGWHHTERQVPLAPRGRDNIPDGLLFLDEQAKAQANTHTDAWKKYQHGTVIVESKRWYRPLDRGTSEQDEVTAPATQMLRYLRRGDDLTRGAVRWGFLTNGAVWRLYFQGVRSISEQFFETDLAALLHTESTAAGDDPTRDHWLRVFALVFGRDSFVPSAPDHRTFHIKALDEGWFYEERVTRNLSEMVFQTVFPNLAKAIALNRPDAALDDVRQATLILLYRLLFLLYAEDRNLLPVGDHRYDDYGLRDAIRGDVRRRKDRNDIFSDTQDRYWCAIDGLCRALDTGDASIGLPPYNGGLFSRTETPLLDAVHIPDKVMAQVIDLLSYEQQDGQRRYINYRDLSVQQLGSIYERLLEFELRRDPMDGPVDGITIRPNIMARKISGSYYTPDALVTLIIRETLAPLIADRRRAFRDRADALEGADIAEADKLRQLRTTDPAQALLTLKICDPAMGSGHFLVSLVDYLADTVIETLAEGTSTVDWAQEPYTSPLAGRIADIRTTITKNAEANGWTIDPAQLDDRHIVRRMVLKRCVYGVDKNPMAVELAKLSLWLHTFTTGAPLSFLDHHLRCGDSLFGAWVNNTASRNKTADLFLCGPVQNALDSAGRMKAIDHLTDAEIAEAHKSAALFAEVERMTTPLDKFLSLTHALDWLNPDKGGISAITEWRDGNFGDPVAIAAGANLIPPANGNGRTQAMLTTFETLLKQAQTLIRQEHFLNWQVAFPGVWSAWEQDGLTGGFDAVIGNPPWDRIKLQRVEWFAQRNPEIAMAPRAADRTAMIRALEARDDPLFADYARARDRTAAMARMARRGGDYPLLSGGDINLYSLFVERALALLAPGGVMGLLTPSGIAADKTAAPFFRRLSTTGRIKALYDFENRKIFFPDVGRVKFCVFVASRTRRFAQTHCAFFLQDPADLEDPDRCFPLTAADFARVNPNTGTAPVFRTRRAAALTTAIYGRVPILVDRSGPEPVASWPLRYQTMFHITSDSALFRTRAELEETEGAWAIGGNIFDSPTGKWLPLYVGRMIYQFDHRAASVRVNPENLHNPAVSIDISAEQKANPAFTPDTQYWVSEHEVAKTELNSWTLAFRGIARGTNERTMIASAVPGAAFGNSIPLIRNSDKGDWGPSSACLLANLNSVVLDFVARSKVQGANINWYIVEQLPILPPDRFTTTRFGPKTAAQVITPAVLELTYTAHDMAPFARAMGHVDDTGAVKPPFIWDSPRRLRLRAKLDAVFFHLYGITSRDDIRHIYATFPIVERAERAAYGTCRSRDLCLAYLNALAAGRPDEDPGGVA